MKEPEIRIKDGWLLRENASKHLHELWGKDSELADDVWMERRVAEYSAAWQMYEKTILNGMFDILNLQFRQNIIDVYIAPWFLAFSDPLVIGVTSEPDMFVDLLTHELIHRLLTDNTLISSDTNLTGEWEQLWGSNHSFDSLIHIPVHAVHKAIYLDVLENPQRLERDIKINTDNDAGDYIKAWDFVNKHDYKQLIKQLKESYRDKV